MQSVDQNVRLWSLPPSGQGIVVAFDETLPEAYRIRLMELGFHPGECVTCLLSPGFGAPKVYRVSNTVFSLDAEIADKVFLASLSPSEQSGVQ